MNSASVLIVEDETAVRESLKAGLVAEGWAVFEAWDRETLFQRLLMHDVSIVTLDLNLGGENGLELARDLRSQRNVPVIMISGSKEPYDRVRGLELGADDFILKPFHIREVILRIERTLQRYRQPLVTPSRLMFDHSVLDVKNHVVAHLDGTPLNLTSMEMRLLELFVQHPGRVLSRDEISNALHGRDWSPYDRTIDGHVARLRRKIETPAEMPMLIRSVRGVGYVFSGEVTVAP